MLCVCTHTGNTHIQTQVQHTHTHTQSKVFHINTVNQQWCTAHVIQFSKGKFSQGRTSNLQKAACTMFYKTLKSGQLLLAPQVPT